MTLRERERFCAQMWLGFAQKQPSMRATQANRGLQELFYDVERCYRMLSYGGRAPVAARQPRLESLLDARGLTQIAAKLCKVSTTLSPARALNS